MKICWSVSSLSFLRVRETNVQKGVPHVQHKHFFVLTNSISVFWRCLFRSGGRFLSSLFGCLHGYFLTLRTYSDFPMAFIEQNKTWKEWHTLFAFLRVKSEWLKELETRDWKSTYSIHIWASGAAHLCLLVMFLFSDKYRDFRTFPWWNRNDKLSYRPLHSLIVVSAFWLDSIMLNV